MRSWRAVLVPVDGSLVAEAAIPVAAEVARRAGALLHLVFVRAPEPLATLPGEVGLLRAQAERGYLASTARGLQQLAPACVTATLPEGEATRAFIDYARAAEADLVVLAGHGRGALGRAWIGHFAQRLLPLVPLPLLVVRPGTRPAPAGPFRNIAVLLDGSERAEAVLDPVTRLGALFGARYALLRLRGGDPGASAVAREYLEEVAQVLRGRGLPAATLVLPGHDVAASASAFAWSAGADLIALATHGHDPDAPDAPSGVADGLLRLSGAPLLSLRAPGG